MLSNKSVTSVEDEGEIWTRLETQLQISASISSLLKMTLAPVCLLPPFPSPGVISGCKPCEGLPQTKVLMTSLTDRRISAAPSPPWQVITLAEPISSPSRQCLCTSCAKMPSGERVLHSQSEPQKHCHRKAVFSLPYDQGSQLQSPALMQNVSKRAIKYLGWEAPASTKNISTLTGLTRSASIWELYKPSPECDTTQSQRVFPESKIQSKIPTFVSWWVQVPTLIHAWQDKGKSSSFFPPSFCVWWEMGPGDTDLLVKTSPLITLVNSENLQLKLLSPVHPN